MKGGLSRCLIRKIINARIRTADVPKNAPATLADAQRNSLANVVSRGQHTEKAAYI